MRTSYRLTAVLIGAAVFGFGVASNASAQVCGDADGNGSVTVTDGVQVLRAAAGLSTTCAQHANSCDVDGNGDVTVTDGVNVLRLAADLAVTTNCPGGGADADVSAVVDVTVPFLTLGLSALGEVSIGSASAADTQNCEDGGSRTTTSGAGQATVVFNACRVSQQGLGRFQFDGQVLITFGIPKGTVQAELQVTDLDNNNRVTDFDGTIQGQVRIPEGGFVVDGGPLEVHESEGGPLLFTLTFHNLAIDSDAHFVSGSVEAEDTSDSFDLQSAEFEVQNSTTATLHVVRDDQTTDDFTVNLQTGDITPAS
jgi:hypothetical protein